jgi:citrate lyase gamma subunit
MGVDRVNGNQSSLSIALGESLGSFDIRNSPIFDPNLDVTLTVSNINDFNAILDPNNRLNKPGENGTALNKFLEAGIDHLLVKDTISASIDWFDFSNLTESHSVNAHNIEGIRTEQNGEINFAIGVDLLANSASPNQFGNLIESLLDSGVTDYVVESSKVEITDNLASAMVDSGMLQALPTANLIINATANLKSITGMEDFAHLYTNLKAMSSLDVDGIKVQNGISKVFVDLGDLGVPTDDLQALADIKSLLGSLDPANDAKSFAHNNNGEAVDISLVMNADWAKTLQKSFNDTELMSYLENLGITEVIGLDPNATSSAPTPVAQTPVPLPEVKIIGPNGDDGALFHELNHNKLV